MKRGEKMNETLEGYKTYLNRRYSEGSRMASSCLYVIERIGKILNHVPTYAYIPDDFTKIKNLNLLHTLYEYVKEEQKKNGGIFNGSTLSKGYWDKSFCSSAIKNYMDYLIETYDGASPVRESHITQHIEETMQKITYGAPGTGKSKQTKDEVAGHMWFRTTFHPDSDYASFVGAYKPRMREDGVALTEVSQKDAAGQLVGTEIHDQRKGIAYDFVDQVFTKAYVEAWKLQKKVAEGATPEPVFLVIEEINRGNCAQIFGDIFQLLDRNGMGFSEYPVEPDSDLGRFIAAKIAEDPVVIDAARKNAINGLYPEAKFDVVEKVLKGEQLLLPNNLFIRATMNTSDQSLFPIDSAFKRRWDWQYVPIAKPDKEGWVDRKIVVGTTKYDWWDFLTIINKHIAKATESEDKQLGYFFVKAPDDTGCITAERFANKVLFYLYGDVFKSYDLPAAAFKREGGAAWAFRDFFHSESAVVLKANGQFVKDADGNVVKTVSDEATQMLKKPGDVNEFELAAFLDHLKWKDATEEKSVGKANAETDA